MNGLLLELLLRAALLLFTLETVLKPVIQYGKGTGSPVALFLPERS